MVAYISFDRYEFILLTYYIDINLFMYPYRYLVKLEEERFVAKGFNLIFPTSETYKYFKFFGDRVPYFDKLYDAYERAYSGNRGKGINRLRRYCELGYLI